MTKASIEGLRVKQTTDKDDVERVNTFFNSKPIKKELHRFIYRPILVRAHERSDRRILYVEDNEEIVGALLVWCESRVLDPQEAQIRLIAVANKYRRMGIGERLCQQAERFAVEHGEKKISADVARNSVSFEFWKSVGYEVMDFWETDNGRGMIRVMKTLTND